MKDKSKEAFLRYMVRKRACTPATTYVKRSRAKTAAGMVRRLTYSYTHYSWLAFFLTDMTTVDLTPEVGWNESPNTHYASKVKDWVSGPGYYFVANQSSPPHFRALQDRLIRWIETGR